MDDFKETLAGYSDYLQRDTPLLWKLKRKISNLIEPVCLQRTPIILSMQIFSKREY